MAEAPDDHTEDIAAAAAADPVTTAAATGRCYKHRIRRPLVTYNTTTKHLCVSDSEQLTV